MFQCVRGRVVYVTYIPVANEHHLGELFVQHDAPVTKSVACIVFPLREHGFKVG